MDVKDARRVLVDDVSDAVQLELGLSDLRGSNHGQFTDLWVGESVHDVLQVRRSGSSPLPRLCAGHRGQLPVLVGPFGDRQVLRGFHADHCVTDDSVQTFAVLLIHLLRPAPASLPAP